MAEEIKDKDMENEKAQADIEAASAAETAETADAANAAEETEAAAETTETGENDPQTEAPDEAETEAEAETENGEKKKFFKEKDHKKDKEKEKDKKKSASEAVRLEARNAELEKQIAEEKDKYARLAAEYDNYRKRTARELDGRYADAKSDVWKNLLPVIDNFERALATEPANGEKDAFREGIELTYKQLKEQMEKAGVTVIEAKGQQFDPERHNAVMHYEDETLGENIVAEEFIKGYMLGDKVLRHSMVKVAN